jgi:hypothetical protein
MREKPSIAQRALVNICTKLALVVVPTSTDDVFIQELASILPSCDTCSSRVVPIRRAAERLVSATNARSKSAAEVVLRQAVVEYHTMAAATLLDEFKKGAVSS